MPVLRSSILFLSALASACSGSQTRSSALGDSDSDVVSALSAGHNNAVRRDLVRLRSATRKFHDITVAQAAGYPATTPQCIANAPMGGMGHHYVDRKLSDDSLELERPEILLYAKNPDGSMKLTAVEYIVPYRVRPPTATPPRIFGQELRRSEELKIWYLHVWAWEKNSNGLFADWNPAVRCELSS